MVPQIHLEVNHFQSLLPKKKFSFLETDHFLESNPAQLQLLSHSFSVTDVSGSYSLGREGQTYMDLQAASIKMIGLSNWPSYIS